MAQMQNDELEFIVDDYYNMVDFEDNPFDEERDQQQRTEGDDDFSDVDDDDDDDITDLSKSKTDTSAVEARNGKDIQGIPWERLNFTRDNYRESRLRQYKNYENLPRSNEKLDMECKKVDKGNTFYDFQFNTRLVKSTIVHFQEDCNFIFLSALKEGATSNF